MSENNNDNTNPIVAAVRYVLGPLVKLSSKLPAPLAYISAVVLAILIIYLLGAVLPGNIIWLIGSLVVVGLIAFIFTGEKQKSAKSKQSALSPNYILLNVTVHEDDDITNGIHDAEVTLVIIETQRKDTSDLGNTNFTIPSYMFSKPYIISARKLGYSGSSIKGTIGAKDFNVYIPLKQISAPRITEVSDTATRLEEGIVAFLNNRGQFPEPAAIVFGKAKSIVRRMISDSDTFTKIEAEIEQRKREDNNWTFANQLNEALALVNALGLSPETTVDNDVFLQMPLPKKDSGA